MGQKIVVKMQFDIGLFENEAEVDKFLHALCEIADSQNKLIKDASATLMVAIDDISDLPAEIQERLKKSIEEKRDPKKFIN